MSSKNTQQLTALALAALAQGEDVRAAVRVNYNGTVSSNVLAINQSLAGVDPDAPAILPEPGLTVAFPSAKQMGVVLTPRRILVWALGMSGKPKQFLGDVPLVAVRDVKAGETNFGPVVRFIMQSGAVVDLEIMKGEHADGFIETVKALLTASPDAAGVSPDPSAGPDGTGTHAADGGGGDGAEVDPESDPDSA